MRITRRGFSVIELLVVIGIVAVLLSILLPVFSKMRERSRRVVCASRVRDLAAAAISYANDSEGRLPSGIRDWDFYEHTPWVPLATYEALYRRIGGLAPTNVPSGTVGDPRLSCPGLGENEASFVFPNRYSAQHGWVLGYGYLGGHQALGNLVGFRSPMRLGDPGSLALFADMNDWSNGGSDDYTGVPHPRTGGARFFYHNGQGTIRPEERGAQGGNVAYLDGSVQWRNISDMKEYMAYTGGSYFTKF